MKRRNTLRESLNSLKKENGIIELKSEEVKSLGPPNTRKKM